MKSKNKYIVGAITIVFIILILYSLQPISNEAIKGNIVVWANDYTYDYLFKVAKEFEENNKRTKIKVINISNDEYLNSIKNVEKEKLPNIANFNFIDIQNLHEKVEIISETNEIIETYRNNFNKNRVKQIEYNEKYMGVPLTSRPIAFFIRKDILNEYGYKVEDINTWENLFKIGIDIFNKTNGDIRIFSSKDIDNIKLLMSAEAIQESKSDIKAKLIVESNIKNIFNTELISYYGDNNYMARIGSIEIINELNNELLGGKWICKLPPSINIGANKFYDLGGENLVVLNSDESNIRLIKNFMIYAATNVDLLQKQLVESRMFPSSLYTYKDKSIENAVKNTNENKSSPFIIFSNISERAPVLKNYKLLKDIIENSY